MHSCVLDDATQNQSYLFQDKQKDHFIITTDLLSTPQFIGSLYFSYHTDSGKKQQFPASKIWRNATDRSFHLEKLVDVNFILYAPWYQMSLRLGNLLKNHFNQV